MGENSQWAGSKVWFLSLPWLWRALWSERAQLRLPVQSHRLSSQPCHALMTDIPLITTLPRLGM